MPAARFVIALAVLLSFAGAARAQGGGGAGKAKAVELLGSGDKKLARGQKLYEKGDIEKALAEYEGALADYQGAYEAFPDPKIYFPIAQAEQRLGRFVDALQHYQQLLEEGKDVAGALKTQVQRELIEVKKNLAAVVIETQPEGALVLIDGSQVAKTPMDQPVFVEPGAHGLTVKLEGFKTVERKVDLAMGKEFRDRTVMVADGGDGGGKTTGGGTTVVGGTQVDRGPERPSKALLVVGISVSSALLVAGTVTGVMALSKHGTFHDEDADENDRENARRDGKQLAGLTDVFLGAALVGGLVTTYYYFGVYKPGMRAAAEAEDGGGGDEEDEEEEEEVDADEEEETAWRFAPVVGDGFAGVAASGRF
ncbi:MAG TPA: PEGA domain-containing protein [Kofleriaceae bacterium]|nr:PEGA domain-containing protein [Kofleriaceae bacterium]